MAQFPVIAEEWYPLSGSQFLSPGVSTALTIPSLPSGQPSKGTVYVGEISVTGDSGWCRMDGGTAAANQGVQMNVGDWRVVYGYQALKAIRLFRSSSATLFTISYFYFRHTP